MTHHTDTERAEFEAAIRATMHDAGEDHIAERLERWPDGAYKDRATGYAWWGYQKAARRAPVVPQGWKLVPKEATPEMLEQVWYLGYDEMRDAYCVLVAAAPQPPEAAQASVSNGTLEAPVQMPEPAAWRYTDARGHYRYRGARPGFAVEYPLLKPEALYTEQQVRELLAAHGIKEQST